MPSRPVCRVEGEEVPCTSCGALRPFTAEFFGQEKGTLRMPCKACKRNASRRARLHEPRRRRSRVPAAGVREVREAEARERESNLWFRVMVREILEEMYPPRRKAVRGGVLPYLHDHDHDHCEHVDAAVWADALSAGERGASAAGAEAPGGATQQEA